MRPGDIIFLVIGVIVVAVVGQLLAYSGRRYVGGRTKQHSGAGSVAILASVVFHLVTLGLLALIAVLPIGGTPAQSVMLRIGILLLTLGVVYGATLGILSHKREDAMVEAAIWEKRRGDRSPEPAEPTADNAATSAPQWPDHYDAMHRPAEPTDTGVS